MLEVRTYKNFLVKDADKDGYCFKSNCNQVLSQEQLDAELEKGYADMQAGRTKSAKAVFADIRKDYAV